MHKKYRLTATAQVFSLNSKAVFFTDTTNAWGKRRALWVVHHFLKKKSLVCLLHEKFTLEEKKTIFLKECIQCDIIFNLMLIVSWWCIKIPDCKRIVYNQKKMTSLFQCPQLVQPQYPWGPALLTVRLWQLRKVDSWIAVFILPENISGCRWSSLPPSGGK